MYVVLFLVLLPAALAGCLGSGNPLERCDARTSSTGHEVAVQVVPRLGRTPAGACIEARIGEESTRSPDAFRVVANETGFGVLRLPAGTWTVSATILRGGGGACADLDSANVTVPGQREVTLDFRDSPVRGVCI